MNTYQVHLCKPATYYTSIEVDAETPEDAKRVALNLADAGDRDATLEWDYGDPGGEVEVSDVEELDVDVDVEKTISFPEPGEPDFLVAAKPAKEKP